VLTPGRSHVALLVIFPVISRASTTCQMKIDGSSFLKNVVVTHVNVPKVTRSTKVLASKLQ